MSNVWPQRAGRIIWRAGGAAVAVADGNPNTVAPAAARIVSRDPQLASDAAWVRVRNAAATDAPSLTFHVYGRMGGPGTPLSTAWTLLGALNAAAAVTPSSTPGGGPALPAGLQVANRFDLVERVVGLAGYDDCFVAVTGTFGTLGTVSIDLGFEAI